MNMKGGSRPERKASFFTSQARFPQYELWAKKTGMFLGPGVYDDNQNYKNLNKMPCFALYVNGFGIH